MGKRLTELFGSGKVAVTSGLALELPSPHSSDEKPKRDRERERERQSFAGTPIGESQEGKKPQCVYLFCFCF